MCALLICAVIVVLFGEAFCRPTCLFRVALFHGSHAGVFSALVSFLRRSTCYRNLRSGLTDPPTHTRSALQRVQAPYRKSGREREGYPAPARPPQLPPPCVTMGGTLAEEPHRPYSSQARGGARRNQCHGPHWQKLAIVAASLPC